jgi:hypothetical protein
MPRSPAPTDYPVNVEGVGDFVFGRRRMADEVRIQVEYARLIQGIETPTEWLTLVANWLATLGTLTVRAPDGWDVMELDPTEEETYDKLFRVYTALIAKEGSFRRGQKGSSQASGAGPVQDA